jgi:hypothetical protein
MEKGGVPEHRNGILISHEITIHHYDRYVCQTRHKQTQFLPLPSLANILPNLFRTYYRRISSIDRAVTRWSTYSSACSWCSSSSSSWSWASGHSSAPVRLLVWRNHLRIRRAYIIVLLRNEMPIMNNQLGMIEKIQKKYPAGTARPYFATGPSNGWKYPS